MSRHFKKTDCQQISFDHYPVTSRGLKENWYYNVEMIQRESLLSGKPLRGFVLSVPHTINTCTYPMPTMGALRLQVYSTIAYGAHAMQYFTYWNPGKDEGYDYHDAPISREGKKTVTYNPVQKINLELKTFSRLFYGTRGISVCHSGVIPRGCQKFMQMPKNISRIVGGERCGFLVSEFEKDSKKYMAVVNKYYKKPTSVRIKTKNRIPLKVNKDLSTQVTKKECSIPAGGVLIFKLN